MKKELSHLPFLLLMLLGVVLLVYMTRTLYVVGDYDAQIRSEVQFRTGILVYVAENYLNHNDLDGFSQFCQKRLKSLSRMETRVTLFSKNGDVLVDSWVNPQHMENHADRPEFPKEDSLILSDREPYPTILRYSTTTQQKMFYSLTRFTSASVPYYLRCSVPKKSLDKLAFRTWRALVVALGLMFAIAFLLVHWFVLPSKKLVRAARRITEGNLQEPIPVAEHGNLHEVTLAMNVMTEKLKEQIFQITRDKSVRDAIFTSLDEGILLLDTHGVIQDMNAAACSILDTKFSNALAHPLSEIWRDQRWMDFFDIPREGVLSLKEDVTLNLPLGAREIRLHIQEIAWEPNQSGFLMVLYDLTPLRRLETYRRDFVANVSHEIKTPLTVIMGVVESLQDGALNDPVACGHFLETLSTHARRLHSLIQDVLSLSDLECRTRREDLHCEERSLRETLELAVSLCRPQAAKRNVRIRVLAEENDLFIFSHVPSLMEQVFVNLLDNAVKYSHDGGDVNVTMERDENKIRVRVEDHGVGIAAVHLPRLFERFYRVDPSRDKATGGTGLGLSIVKHIVQLHGGVVSVESAEGKGSIFTLQVTPTPR